ncbi:MAG: hypothetical protein MUF67_04430 [Desulfobacterales bacterium]|jgi:hypothetical protein|nr:hypothetical protein [Desulfobacterales bacterium]
MSFKANLLQKIKIDGLFDEVLRSIGPTGSERRTDKDAMRRLLAMGGFASRRERDLDLYFFKTEAGKAQVMVLDNDLPIYQSGAEDVALRKSPTVKEMLNIRNIVKILNDADVVVSKKEQSAATIRRLCLQQLDLRFSAADIEALAAEGRSALELGNTETVSETLMLFAAILGLQPLPKALKVGRCEVWSAAAAAEQGRPAYGPLILFEAEENRLLLLDQKIHPDDPEALEHYHQVALGKQPPSASGAAVWTFLQNAVLARDSREVALETT